MGYYTQYHIAIDRKNGQVDYDKINEDLQKISTYSSLNIDEDTDSIKWYDHDDNMIELSRLHPNVLFRVDGVGEEKGDVWRSYYCNGETESAQATLTFPTIDYEKMFKEFATTDRIISNEEFKNAQDEITRSEQAIARAKNLIERYNGQ